MYEIYKKLLEEKGVTTADVCKATGISQSTMSNWKKRGNSLSVKNAQKIADYFGVSIEYFLYKEPYTSETPVGTFAPDSGYYTDMETAKLAQRLFKDPKYRVLFDAADGAPAEDLQIAADMLRRFKEARGE